MLRQKTLKNVARITGITVHSGKQAQLTLCPAPPNSGIIFERVDLDKPVNIPARTQFVANTKFNTTLMREGIEVATVEHLLSALAGLGIDNAKVQVDTDELPVIDGSAKPYVCLLQSAGIVEQDAAKQFIRIKKQVTFKAGDKSVALLPYHGFKLSFTLEYNHPVFKHCPKQAHLEFSPNTYIKEISRARTFGFLADYEKLQAMNLGKGASLDNAIVIDDHHILNKEGLRYEDEFAKHKILDAIGDLYLLGHSIIGAFVGHKSGHTMNNQLLQKLLTIPDAWEYLTFKDNAKAPVAYLETAVIAS